MSGRDHILQNRVGDPMVGKNLEKKHEHEGERVEATKKNLKDEHQTITNSQGTEYSELSVGKYNDDHGKATKLLPQQTMACSTGVVSDSAQEPTGKLPAFKSFEEEADYYYYQCMSLKAEKKELEAQNRSLTTSKNKYKDKAEDLRLDLVDEERRSSEKVAVYEAEINKLKSKVEGVKESYIKSVNNVNTGLDSITDEEFEPKLRELHYKVRSNPGID
jgi:hypothetical protein